MAIRRGALPQDNYTQVLNAWLRDPATTFKGKGILCAIASHKADYELTVAQLVAQSKEGPDAVYTGLHELVKVGYLRMERARDERGRLGETDFDLVAEPPGMYERVKAVTWGNTKPGKSRSGESTPGETTSGESGTKKTRVKKTKVLEDQPPSSSGSTAPAPDPADTRGEEEEPNPTEDPNELQTAAAEVLDAVLSAASVPRARRPVGSKAVTLAAMLAERLTAGWWREPLADALGAESMENARSVYAVLKSRIADLPANPPRRARTTPGPRQPAGAPAWCGYCQPTGRMTGPKWDPKLPEDAEPRPCPRCHPDHAAAAAA